MLEHQFEHSDIGKGGPNKLFSKHAPPIDQRPISCVYVAGNSRNQAFPEIPAIPAIARQFWELNFLTYFKFWEKAQHHEINFKKTKLG